MNTNTKKILITIAAISFLVYSAFLVKKSFVDKGLGDMEEEKEELLGRYVIMMGLPNNKLNRDKYQNMTIEQLKKELDFDSDAAEKPID